MISGYSTKTKPICRKRQFQRRAGDLLYYMPNKTPKNSIENLGNRNLVKPIHTPIISLITLNTLSDTSVRYPALTNNEDTVFEELDGAISEKL